MFSRIRHLVVKELIELGQDPRLFGIVIVAPIIQLVLLTYAATTDVRNVPVLIADADRSASSRELIDRFNASPTFTLAGVVGSTAEVEGYIERGDAW
ncbi:MAG: ABC transporter permease, partial [Vicinamibacterales bacterium]